MEYSNNSLNASNIRKNKVIELFKRNINKLKTIKNLNGGLSNDLFLINDTHVWKIFRNSLIDHKYEVSIMEKLEYFFISYKDKMNICYKFIDGHQKKNDSYNLSLETVFKEVRNIHKMKVKTPHMWHSLIPKWLDQLSDKSLKDLLTIKYNKINNKIGNLNVAKDNVFCHNDITVGNVLFNKNKCFIIDWEFGGINYYFFELGNMVCEYCIDYEKESYNFDSINKGLIKKVIGYYNNDSLMSDEKIEKVEIGIQMSHFTWALYALLMVKKPIDPVFDYFKFAQSRIGQLYNN